MAYQVLARKWRPQRFDDVVGQQAVTRTLRNALTSGRIAHAFVFAGPRGCGKTTTARILARALNCAAGPTPDPCGECDACIEIAQGRDIDVFEFDAASHTQVDNIREMVIAGLAIAPVRNRYKVFIIDEVHQLSNHSFNALLKSIEEPPAHVVFMMATTEPNKIPDTILSRSQVFEFKTIPAKAITAQLRTIVDAEKIDAPDAALALIARAAEGSMRDAQSALDQVIAFAGAQVSIEDVTTVLGLVGRDLLFDLVEAIADEDALRGFELADRAVESGHDLRLVCRELASVVRDMMMLSIDPSRAGADLVEGERERLTALAARFSREDVMRAFDLLSKAEQEIRQSSQPRYYFEMALLRWIHLRKLVPLTDLLDQMGGSSRPAAAAARTTAASPGRPAAAPVRSAAAPAARAPLAPQTTKAPASAGRVTTVDTTPPEIAAAADAQGAPAGGLKDRLLAEVRTSKNTLYSLAIAQAQRIDVTHDRVTFTFAPNQNVARMQLDQNREWLEAAAAKITGRRISVASVQAGAEAQAPATAAPTDKAAPQADQPAPKRDLKAEALESSAVQAMLEVFPAAIRDVEEM